MKDNEKASVSEIEQAERLIRQAKRTKREAERAAIIKAGTDSLAEALREWEAYRKATKEKKPRAKTNHKAKAEQAGRQAIAEGKGQGLPRSLRRLLGFSPKPKRKAGNISDPNRNSTHITISLKKDERQQLQRIADQRGQPITRAAADLVRQALAASQRKR